MTTYFIRRLICCAFMCGTLSVCYAKVGKATVHVSSIYINTPDSSVKAFVTDKAEENPVIGRMYYWYSANQLCYSNGSYSGKLLHGQYSSFYPNHFLQSQGQFLKGLKDGCWKRWLPDGSLHEIIHYKNGLLNGIREIYSPNGQLRERIYYRKGVRAGKTTIFSQDGKDSVILYKKGVPVVKKEPGMGDEERGTGNGGRGGQEQKADKNKQRLNTDTAKSDSAKNSVNRMRNRNTKRDSIQTNSRPAKDNKSPNSHNGHSGADTSAVKKKWRWKLDLFNSDSLWGRKKKSEGPKVSDERQLFPDFALGSARLIPRTSFPVPHSPYE